MKKPIIMAIVLAIILATILSLAMVSSKGNYVKIGHTHSFTKAICDSKSLCQDYEIFCKDQKVIKMNPITGAVVQFSESWQDPRTSEQRNEFC